MGAGSKGREHARVTNANSLKHKYFQSDHSKQFSSYIEYF